MTDPCTADLATWESPLSLPVRPGSETDTATSLLLRATVISKTAEAAWFAEPLLEQGLGVTLTPSAASRSPFAIG